MFCKRCDYNGYQSCSFTDLHFPSQKAEVDTIKLNLEDEPKAEPDINIVHAGALNGKTWCGLDKYDVATTGRWDKANCTNCLAARDSGQPLKPKK